MPIFRVFGIRTLVNVYLGCPVEVLIGEPLLGIPPFPGWSDACGSDLGNFDSIRRYT